MQIDTTQIEQLREKNRDLTATCRIWMAACEARDERIAELEAECARLRQRVGRLTRVGQRPQAAQPAAVVREYAR